MKRIILATMLLAAQSFAVTVFASQGGGSVSCGTDGTQTTTAVASLTWTAGNTYKLCGVITSSVTVGASGTLGNVITVYFESGSKISQAFCPSSGCLNVASKNFITIDGGAPCGPSV